MLTEKRKDNKLQSAVCRRRRGDEGSLMGGIGDPHSSTVPAALATSDQRGNTSAVTNPRTRPYYFRMCKKASSTHINSLSDDLLLEILLRVSAEDIHDVARFVCRRWKRLIHGDAFAYAHLHRTNYGLLFLGWNCTLRGGSSPIFMTATQGRIEIYELSYKLRSNIATCNGLVLDVYLCYDTDNLCLRILNPTTKARFNLPWFFDDVYTPHFCIAYAAASMDYKVVATYRCSSSPYVAQCAILTVGVDNTWRHVVVDQLSPRANYLLNSNELITEGFVHWVSVKNDTLTLNVETETFTHTHAPLLPEEYQDNRRRYYYLSTGRHLSVLMYRGDFLWEVWEMKGESGEWRKLLPSIDFRASKCRIPQCVLKDEFSISPIGWIKYPEILTLHSYNMDRVCIIYNLDKDEIDSFKLPACINSHSIEVHRISLVWIK